MGPGRERYVLRGGQRGYDRLLLLARDRWPDTLAFLQRASVGPGMRCADVGFGGGGVSLELARIVGPGGRVTGIEMDEVNVQLARRKATEANLSNVEFRQMNANDWNEPGAYDLVYSRFLLQHLSAPIDLLRRMWAAVRPGGTLAVEDADFDAWCCDPPNGGFAFFVRTYAEVLRRNGGDPTTGRKLYRYFLEAGIPPPEVHLVEPVRIAGEAKSLPWTTLDGATDAIVSANLATREEIAVQLAELARFGQDPTSLISGPRIYQTWSRRDSSASSPRAG
jgi:ubiquinone/menaquinone biosynthesis C-methylase UbiE